MSSKPTISPNTLYILYNANASVMGKLSYGYRKLTCAKDKPACAACDITNGGLSLEQTPAWKEVKGEIQRERKVEVRELHRDELSSEMKKFIDGKALRYPTVLYSDDSSNLHLTMDSNELAACNGNAKSFGTKLNEKGALGSTSSSL